MFSVDDDDDDDDIDDDADADATDELFILWPCVMLIVIAKHNLIENYLLDSLEGKSESDRDNSILEINA